MFVGYRQNKQTNKQQLFTAKDLALNINTDNFSVYPKNKCLMMGITTINVKLKVTNLQSAEQKQTKKCH